MYRKEVGEGEKRHAPKSLGKFGEVWGNNVGFNFL